MEEKSSSGETTMSTVLKIIVSLFLALTCGVIVLVAAATVMTWITFFFTPLMWVDWNLMTLPFQYNVEWGYSNFLVQGIALLAILIAFVATVLGLD